MWYWKNNDNFSMFSCVKLEIMVIAIKVIVVLKDKFVLGYGCVVAVGERNSDVRTSCDQNSLCRWNPNGVLRKSVRLNEKGEQTCQNISQTS